MNLREGTRRLALLLGAVGAILGGFVSYLELQTVLSQRSQHNKFEQLTASDVVTQERKCRLLGYYSGCSELPPLPQGYTLDKPKYTIEEPDGRPGASELSKGDIKTIQWTKKYDVESIVTEDGQTLYPTPAPSVWLYLLVALFPVLGFLIPWGAIRAIEWVVAGFVQPSK
jgi:hypothetical protein